VSGVALHGGGAAKVSGDFEEDWTLLMMLDMVSGHADRITLEPPGTAGWGFEFVLGRASTREWHQVKFQNGKIARWSLAELASADVLENFYSKLISAKDATCWFVSSDSAAPLSRLCDRASLSPSVAAFSSVLLSSEELKTAFNALESTHWKLTEAETWRWLRDRVFVETISHRRLSMALIQGARTYLAGEPSGAIDALRAIKRALPYFEVSSDLLEAELKNRGFPPRIWSDISASPADAVRRTSQRFREGVDPLRINQSLLPRAEVDEIRRLLEARHPPPAILLTGNKGHGKSTVISAVVAWTLGSQWKVLTVDTTALSREQSTSEVSGRLGLPDTPGVTLAAAAKEGRGLLVIDALDAVGINRDKPLQLFQVLGDVVREVRAHSNLTVLVSCRSEDLASDDRLRELADGSHLAPTIEVPALTPSQVVSALAYAAIDPSQLNADQRELIRVPTRLRYLIESKEAGPFDFATEQDLIERFLGLPGIGERR